MRTSIGTGIVLMAVGAILLFAVRVPADVEQYIDVLDLGLILIWTGLLIVGMQVYLYKPRRQRRRVELPVDEGDPWREHDVHRPGYAGETQRLPTIRRPRDR